jgi:hypothetical protein
VTAEELAVCMGGSNILTLATQFLIWLTCARSVHSQFTQLSWTESWVCGCSMCLKGPPHTQFYSSLTVQTQCDLSLHS